MHGMILLSFKHLLFLVQVPLPFIDSGLNQSVSRFSISVLQQNFSPFMPCKHTCQAAPGPLLMPTSRKALHFLMMSVLVHERTRMMRPSRLVSRAQLQLSWRRWREEGRCAAPWCWDDDARTCISKPKVFIFHRRRYNKWYGNFKLNMIQDQLKTAFFAQTVSLLTHPLRSWEKEPTICMGLGSAFWYDYILNMYVAGELILSNWRWQGSKTVLRLSQIFPTKH